MAKKITPEGLRKAAEEMEKAAKAATSAAAAKKVAETASKEAEKADAKARATFGAIGVNSGGGGNKPPQVHGGEPKDDKSSKKCCWCSWLAIGLAVLALIFGTILAFNKASNGDVDEVKKTARNDRAVIASVDNKANQALKDSASANKKAESADKKADEALFTSAKKCDGEVCCKTAEKPKCNKEKKPPKKASSKKKDEKPKHAITPLPVVTPPPVVTVVAPEPVVAPCCVPAPHLNITTNSSRTDGRCVIAINDGSTTKYIRLDQEKGSRRLLAFQVQNSVGDVDRNLPITYVGYIDGSEKKTVELTGTPSCASSMKAFSEDRVFQWTAHRLRLGDKCKVVGRV